MSDENLTRLWSLLDQNRGSRQMINRFGDISSIFQFAQENDISLTFDDLRKIANRMGPRVAEGLCPAAIVEFIIEYLSRQDVKSILDPWAGLGSLLIPLSKNLNPDTSEGIEPNDSCFKVAKSLDSEKNIKWIVANPLVHLDKINNEFDVIVSNLPWGVRPQAETFQSDEGDLEIRDDVGHLVILKSCLRLSEKGFGIFTVPLSFIAASRRNNVYNNLNKFNLFLEAFIAIYSGAFAPQTMLRSALVIIRKGIPTPIFVGELSDNFARNKVLIENLSKRMDGKELALGKVVEPKVFKGYHALVSEEKIDRMASRIGLKPVPITTITKEINYVRHSRGPDRQTFEEKANSVYLPLIGRSNAVSSLEETTLKPHNYAQLVINPEIATSYYVSSFFNTPLGHVIREGACSGTTIPKITKTSLPQMNLYLPDPKTQIQTEETSTRISNLVSELQELQNRIWSKPLDLSVIQKEIEKVNKEDRFADWLDNLPFPLASILWAYHAANGNIRRRYEYLDHFFEALAEFMATFLLSGFQNDPNLFDEVKAKFSEQLAKNRLSFDRSTFGTWVNVAERLSKEARRMLNNKKQEAVVRERLFCISDVDILNKLFSSKLIAILKDTNNLRNNWRGHGGVVSDRVAHERLVTLQSYLSGVRECFGDIWDRYYLIQPHGMKFIDGIFNIFADKIMGTRTPFETISFKTREPLENNLLHFIGQEEQIALKLLPFIKIMESPKTAQNACYFYNRKEPKGFRFISYHFEAEAEFVSEFKEIDEVLVLMQSK